MRFPHQMKLYTDQPPEPTLFPHTVCPQVPRVLPGVLQDSQERLTGSISCFLSHFSWVPPSGLQTWRRTAPFPSGACRSVSLHPLWLARRFSSWSLSWWTSSFLDPVHRGDSAFLFPKSGSAVLSCRAWEGETKDKWILYLRKVSANEICFLNCLQHLQIKMSPVKASKPCLIRFSRCYWFTICYCDLLSSSWVSRTSLGSVSLSLHGEWVESAQTSWRLKHRAQKGQRRGSPLHTAASWLYWTDREVWWRWEGRKIITQLSRASVSAMITIRLHLLMRIEFSRGCGPAIWKDQ